MILVSCEQFRADPSHVHVWSAELEVQLFTYRMAYTYSNALQASYHVASYHVASLNDVL